MQEAVFRIRKIFFRDPYPDFTDQYSDSDPDPTHLLVIFNKNTFLKHHITDKKNSQRHINTSGDQR